ncbi:NUDIX hydrolase [Fodinibius halophilus]|uniref:GDP-mannose pyrophosphatase n=1 Tax=Fodinibius halophilus TaxID=1736908 RepID=A0A6M1T2N7_9BACT|nr:NUDIX hydrolase [Fodinibius halophilus]NGP87495.1 NUDIX hydrolase [Fodinibius halophilus]
MSEKSFRFSIEPWSVTHQNKEYQTPIFNLLHRKMKLESEEEENEGDFYVLKAPEWVNVLPITSDDEVVLVEQYRYGIEEPTLEVPGGMVDPGEQPLEAIQRELVEETGYQSEHWQSLGKVSANPAIMTNFTHLFLAENCTFEGLQEPEGDIHERIKVHKVPLEEFLSFAADETIHHTIVLATVARYLLYRNEME